MKNSIVDLRNHLFATLEALQDKYKPMDIDRAKAIAEVAQVAVNSAKVEVDFARVTGSRVASEFLSPKESLPKIGTGDVVRRALTGGKG